MPARRSRAASGSLFLHADTRLPSRRGSDDAVGQAETLARRVGIGCFRFALDSRVAGGAADRDRRPRCAWRCSAAVRRPGAVRASRCCSKRLGGYADLPIMEDVDLVRRLRAHGRLFRSPSAGRDVGPPLGARRLGRPNGSPPRADPAVFLRRAAGAADSARSRRAAPIRMPPDGVCTYNRSCSSGVTGAGPPASKGLATC